MWTTGRYLSNNRALRPAWNETPAPLNKPTALARALIVFRLNRANQRVNREL